MENVGILVVDNDEASRSAIQQVLSCEDWRIGMVSDANRALQELVTGNWTLVIANVETAVVSGMLYATLKELAFSPVMEPGKTRLRVLFVVPEAEESEIQAVLERDGVPYTFKPFHFNDFLEKVSDLLMETEAISSPIRRVRQEDKAAADTYERGAAQRATGRSTGMFANRGEYSMTEEEIAAYERDEIAQLQRKKKKNPQHLG